MKLRASGLLSGSTYDAFQYNSAGEVWNGAAFVPFVDADFASYRTSSQVIGSNGRFFGGDAVSGTVEYEVRIRSGTLAGSIVWWEAGEVVTSNPASAAVHTDLHITETELIDAT